MLHVSSFLVRVPWITDCSNDRGLIIPEMRSDKFLLQFRHMFLMIRSKFG